MSSQLFTPFTLRGLTLRNRIVISPMCQYSAADGSATDWHLVHLGGLALSGASLLILEATAVLPEGRITPHCLGLWSDENEAALARVLEVVRGVSPIALGIQIGHAGRKASTHRPWEGRGVLVPEEGAWQTVAPSAIPFADGWHTPQALDRAGMVRIRDAFVATAKRALRLGFELLELHSAHGYLLSSFVSPLSNRRDDEYGGSLQNRMRFPLEVARAVRAVWPADKPLSAKINGSDWVEGGWTADDAVAYARALREAGVDVVMASSGGVSPLQRVPDVPGYQVSFAARIRAEAGVPSAALGLIADPHHAESVIATGEADLVALARAMLFNPRWAYHGAVALGAELPYVPQYRRASPSLWAPARKAVTGP